MEQCYGMDTFSLSSIHFYVLVQVCMAQLCSNVPIILKNALPILFELKHNIKCFNIIFITV